MQTDTILNGILAVLIEDRDGPSGRSTVRVLAEAGLTDEHIAMLTGRDPARLDQPPVTAFGHAAVASAPARTR
jgi:transcription initiation factor IIE alpha subunit